MPSHNKYTTSSFIKKAREVHSTQEYDYSQVEYINGITKVKFNCRKEGHGVWEATPHSHLTGSGCPPCARERNPFHRKISNSEFIERCKNFNGDRYDYTTAVYNGMVNDIEIICEDHGAFKVKAQHHLFQGTGCPHCEGQGGGYVRHQPGSLYMLIFDNITKIGISNRAVRTRCQDVCRDSGKKFEIAFEHKFEDGDRPFKIERKLLNELKKSNKSLKDSDDKFEGYTECFYDVNRDLLLSRIEQLIQEHTEAHNKQ